MAFAFENQVTRQLLLQYGFGLYLEKPETVTATEIEDARLSSAQYTKDQFEGAWVRLALAEFDLNVLPPAWNNMVVPIAGYDRLRGVISLGRQIPLSSNVMGVEIWQRANPLDIRRELYEAVHESVRVPAMVPLYDAWIPQPWWDSINSPYVFDAVDYVLNKHGDNGTIPMDSGGAFTVGPSSSWWYYAAELVGLGKGEALLAGFEVTAASAAAMDVAVYDLGTMTVGASKSVEISEGWHQLKIEQAGTVNAASVAFRVPGGSVTLRRIGVRRERSVTAVLPPFALHADAVTAVGLPAGGSTQLGPLLSEIPWALSHGTDTVVFSVPPPCIPAARVLVPPETAGDVTDLASSNTGVVGYYAPVYVLAAAAARNLLRRVELDYADVQGYSNWLQAAKTYAEAQLAQWRRGLLVNERSQNRVDHGNFAAPLGGYVEQYVRW